jgi:predicted pyridoxine 5'-phosphate oxidase superfamily flavin-nucleotide-binding protein
VSPLSPEALQRLETEKNLWVASARPDGRPHLVPVWFVYQAERFHFCIQPESVKARNLRRNPRVVLALEGGSSPVICEGSAALLPGPPSLAILDLFQHKYEWDLRTEGVYTLLVEVTPEKWLVW